MRPILLVFSLLAPLSAAHAIGILGFDHARPLEAGRVEAGLGAAAGDSVFNFYGIGRFGLLPDLEAMARGGVVTLGSERDETGFELDGGVKFRFLRQQDTGNAVTVAAMGTASILNAENTFLLGVDPSVVASHHFTLTEDRELFISAHIGLAVTFIDQRSSDTEFGLLGAFTAGVDIIPQVQLSLEAKLRDDLKRAGLAVTYLF
jgi:hypothetical protein